MSNRQHGKLDIPRREHKTINMRTNGYDKTNRFPRVLHQRNIPVNGITY